MATPAEKLPAKLDKQPLIVQYLHRYKDQIAAALPKHMTPDRMARIVTTEVRKVPILKDCNAKSLFGAVIQASQLGLEPGSALGHAYLVPFWNSGTRQRDVQLIIGYRGMIELARRSGQIISIEARVVHERDKFSYRFGLNPDLQHVPHDGEDHGEITHFYAVARLAGGGVQWEVMTLAAVLSVRDKSEGYRAFKEGKIRSNPWDTHFEEMGKKTVIRRLFKYLPVSVEIQHAVSLDEMADAGINQQNGALIDGEFLELEGEEEPEKREPETRTEALKDRLRASAANDAPQAEPGAEPGAEPPASSEGAQASGQGADPQSTPPTSVDLCARAKRAETLDELDLIRSLADEHLNGQAKANVTKQLNTRYEQLKAEGKV